MGRSNATCPFVLLVRQILKIWFVYTFEAVSDFTKIVGILKKKNYKKRFTDTIQLIVIKKLDEVCPSTVHFSSYLQLRFEKNKKK